MSKYLLNLVLIPLEFVFAWVVGMWISDTIGLAGQLYDNAFLLIVLLGLFYLRYRISKKIILRVYLPILVVATVSTAIVLQKYFVQTAAKIKAQHNSDQ